MVKGILPIGTSGSFIKTQAIVPIWTNMGKDLTVPRKAEWFQKLGSVFEQLRQAPLELVDRSTVEQLFQVKPRQAIRILRRLGARPVGGALLLSRDGMLSALEKLAKGEEVQFEQRRRRQLGLWLEQARHEARSRQVRIPEVTAIPEGIHFEPGKLEIRFNDPVELLQKMMHLAQIAAEDWNSFLERAR